MRRLARRRASVMGLSFLALSALATACGVDSTPEEDSGKAGISSGGRRPGGGVSSGGQFGSSGESSSTSGSSSGRSSSSSSSSSGESSSSSSSGESSSSSSSGEPGCDDPNDAPDFGANTFSPVNAGSPAFQVPGVLDGALDSDWYGFDITGSPVTAISLLQAIPAELCVYMECKAGTLTLQCQGGSSSAVDFEGNPGCCATGNVSSAASLSTYMYCSGPDDSYATVSVVSLAEQCVDYTTRVKF